MPCDVRDESYRVKHKRTSGGRPLMDPRTLQPTCQNVLEQNRMRWMYMILTHLRKNQPWMVSNKKIHKPASVLAVKLVRIKDVWCVGFLICSSTTGMLSWTEQWRSATRRGEWRVFAWATVLASRHRWTSSTWTEKFAPRETTAR